MTDSKSLNRNVGKKVPQVGGNSHMGINKPPSVPGNTPQSTSTKKDSGITGNFVPGAKFNR